MLTRQSRRSASSLFAVLLSTTRKAFRHSVPPSFAASASCLGIAALALAPAVAQDTGAKYQIQPPRGRPGFMVKVEMDNCKHTAAKAPVSSQPDAFIACMEKLGYKVQVEQTGNAATPASDGTPAASAAAAPAAVSGKVDFLADGSASYTYAGTVDIGGVRVGMSAAEAKRALHEEKLTNYQELPLTLRYGRPENETHDVLRGAQLPIEVPNSEFLNAIVTDNRPPIKLDHAKYVYPDGRVDPHSTQSAPHSYFDDVDGKVEIFEADFTPNRGQEVVVGISHAVFYDWSNKHKGMLLQDFTKGFASKYKVQVPTGLDSNDVQVAIWNVGGPDHKLLQSLHYIAPGTNGCNPGTLPAHVNPGPYETVHIGGNYAMERTQGGGLGRIANTCGVELLYLRWKVGNPSEPVDRQIVTEYTVAVVAPMLELAGTNKAFAVIQDAMSQQGDSDAKKAAEEGKNNKNAF